MTDLQEIFDSLNLNKVLIGILTEVKEVSVPITFFSDVPDRQLEVKSNEDNTAFVFSLKDN